jgi:hypothetical protein
VRKRVAKNLDTGARFDRFNREVPTKGARARHRMKETMQVAHDRVQPRALDKFARDIGNECLRGRFG